VETRPVIDLNNIYSLSDFQRNARAHLDRLKKTGKPEVLTVHGQAEVVIQNAEAYQRLLDLAENAAAIVGIQRGLQGMNAGTGEDAEDAFRSLEQELEIPSEHG
jgi:PHD/YefM family antitoxin component YafN of YafNO toxin-antitoxin module